MLVTVSFFLTQSFKAVLTNIFPTDKPQEPLETDSKFAHGQNPTIGTDSPANK